MNNDVVVRELFHHQNDSGYSHELHSMAFESVKQVSKESSYTLHKFNSVEELPRETFRNVDESRKMELRRTPIVLKSNTFSACMYVIVTTFSQLSRRNFKLMSLCG